MRSIDFESVIQSLKKLIKDGGIRNGCILSLDNGVEGYSLSTEAEMIYRRLSMRKEEKQYKAVFRAKIDFNYNEPYQESLHPGGVYYLNKHSEWKVSYEDIANEAVWIINSGLKPELHKYTSISIKEVEVQAVYEGSIEIIYSVVLSLLDLVGGLKDLYDAVQLIKEISKRHINKKLSDRFGRHFIVDTYVIVPEYRNHCPLEKKMIGAQEDSSVAKRDAFFYYLMVANIVLLIIVGILVFGATKIVYFS